MRYAAWILLMAGVALVAVAIDTGLHAARNANEVLRQQDWSRPWLMSDVELLQYRRAVETSWGHVTDSMGMLAGGGLVLAVVATVLFIAASVTSAARRSPRWFPLLLAAIVVPAAYFAAGEVRRQALARFPRPDDFVLTAYEKIVEPRSSTTTELERLLLEVDPDGDSPAVIGQTQRDALAHLQAAAGDANLPQDQRPLKPSVVLKSRAAVSELLASPDGKRIFLMNIATGRLHAIDLAAQSLSAAMAVLSPRTEGLCLSSDGQTLFATASPPGHLQGPEHEGRQSGRLYVIDANSLQVERSVELKFDPFDIASDRSNHLLISSGSNQEGTIYVLDAATLAMTGRFFTRTMALSLHYSGRDDTFYASGIGSSGTAFYALRLGTILPLLAPDKSLGFEALNLPVWGPCAVAPGDGEVAFREGPVVNLTTESPEMLLEKLPPHLSLAWDAAARRVLVGTSAGELQLYSWPDCRLVAAFRLPRPAYQLAWDEGRNLLIAALDEDGLTDLVAFRSFGGMTMLDPRIAGSEEAKLQKFRSSLRVTGRNQGPVCIFDLTGILP